MQRGIAGRIGSLEEFLLPLSASVFLARVRTHARRSGTSFGSSFDSLISKVSDHELDLLATEFERIAFGDDTAARDAAKSEVLAAAGYPDWNLAGEESRDAADDKTTSEVSN
jgi:hypothetical protein